MAEMSQFFENVENYRPMKEGRPAQVLGQGTLEPRKLRYENDEAKQRLQRDLGGEDPLQAYVHYIRKLKDLYPSGNKVIIDALHDAAMHFHDVDAYKNDPRLLNIFLELADKQTNPRETFEFMKDHHIGEDLTNFHLAMAAAFERAKDYNIAERSYSEAVTVAKRRSIREEFDLAMTHLTHFKRRMARRHQEARAMHGPRSPEAQRALMFARSSATATRHAQQQQHHLPPPSGLRTAMGGPAAAISSRRTGQAPQSTRAPQFNIFDERRMGPTQQARPTEANWSTLETEQTGVENQAPARPWTEVGTFEDRVGRTAPVQQPSFTIWTEPAEETPSVAVDEAALQMEQLHLGPQSAAKRTATTQTPGLQQASPSMEVLSTPPSSNPDDRTINTRLAYNDMMELFASPSMSVARPTASNMPMFTPAIGLATRFAEDDEGQNVSPNIILRPGESAATLRRSTLRRPASARPALATIEQHDESMSPSFRKEITHPPPQPQEQFTVFRDISPESASRQPQPQPPQQQQLPPQPQSHKPVTVNRRGEGLGMRSVRGLEAADAADATYDGGTLGIGRVLAFDPVSTQSVNRPRTMRMMSSTSKPPGPSTTRFEIFKD